MLHQLFSGQNTTHSRDLAALLKQPPFDAARDDPDRFGTQRRIYEQLYLLNQRAGGGSALLADRQRFFDTLAFAATVSPPLFNVAQAHYGVCLSTIKLLGKPSAELDRIIADIDSLSTVAAILITEVGVACSHLEVGTRAEYDLATDSFILTTPDESACKFMANVALDGVAKTGVVFARLWCNGKDRGLFPFVVPIRDSKRVFDGIHVKALPGTSSMGLDYSLVSFAQVRVPRAHWLQDNATISADGQFHDPLGDTDQRLVRSLGVSSGNATTATAVGVSAAARACIWTNLRYAQRRKTRARLGGNRQVVEFRNQQSLLFGALSEAYVISHFAHRLLEANTRETMAPSSMATVPWAAINRMGAFTKAIAVAGAADVIRNCRRASGAHGCLGANRFGNYEDLTDAYSSAGGDNQLILLEIGRDLASSPSKIPADLATPDSPDNADAMCRLASIEERRQHDRATHGLNLDTAGEEALFSIWNPRLPALLDLARTHGRRLALESFLQNDAGGEDRQVLTALATIYAVEHFGASLAYEVRDRALANAFDVVHRSLDRLLDVFGLSTEVIPVPMAQDDYVRAYVGNLRSGI
jgi:acyl-CoA oxidase